MSTMAVFLGGADAGGQSSGHGVARTATREASHPAGRCPDVQTASLGPSAPHVAAAAQFMTQSLPDLCN